MKIRTGFVSNSSSTSFCIYGTSDLYLKDGVKIPYVSIGETESQCDCEDVDDVLNTLSREDPSLKGLDSWHDPGGNVYVGMSYLNMEQDETRKQFEDRAREAILKVARVLKFKKSEVTVGPLAESWYDG